MMTMSVEQSTLENKELTTLILALMLGFVCSFHSELLGWVAGLGSYIFFRWVQRGPYNGWDEDQL